MREMKNSSVEWIGEIPVDWDTIKIKQLPDRSIENSFVDGDWIESPDISNEGIRYLTTGNIGDGKYKKQGNGFVTLEVFQNLNCKYAYPSDLVISRLNAPYGRSCILPDDYSEYVLAVDNVILRTNNDKKYICYITQCDGYQKSVEDNAKGTTMKRISRTNLGNVLLPFPPLSEQHRIADFLDEKCAKIDAVIEKQKQVIEKLKEYKLSIITEAVTKGLDPTVPMKDSGVEWIGEIPKGWKVTKLSRVCKTSSGSTPARNKDNEYFLDDAKIRWVRTLDLNDGLVYDSSEKISNVALLNSSCSIMPKDTVCVAMYGGSGTIGKCGILQKECATNQAICSIVCDNKIINPYYMFYQMISSRKYWMKFAVGTRKDPNISQEIVANAIVVAPSLNIQSEIIGYLNNKCSVIDSAIVKKQSIVEKLTEYKKSLIYEVVTGKREVL